MKDYLGALIDYVRITELDSLAYEAFYNAGNIYNRMNEADKAIQFYSKAIAIHPRYAVAYHNRGFTRFKKKDYPGALDDYNSAIKYDSAYGDAYAKR